MDANTAFELGRTASQEGKGVSGRFAVPAKYRNDWFAGFTQSEKQLATPRAQAARAATLASFALIYSCNEDIIAAMRRSKV